MFSHEKDMNSLKDTKGVPAPLVPPWRDRSGSYSKTQKLITALYMVTDIMDTDEPLRNKLRTAGLEILSDTHNPSVARTVLAISVEEILSFLNIAITMNFISEMNGNILIKEFTSLKASLLDHADVKPSWLEEFLGEDSPLEGWQNAGVDKTLPPPHKGYSSKEELNSKGHVRMGVQKAGTLMKALKDISVSDRDSFNILKQERRNAILKTIKNATGGATISDIKANTNVQGSALHNVGEKTLQRELMSMTKDGVLNKTGEKRWSRYFMK